MPFIVHIASNAFLQRLAFVSLLVLPVLSAGCEAPLSVPDKVPKLCVTSSINFGDVSVGTEADDSIPFVSCGGDSVNIGSQLIRPPFSLISPLTDSIFSLGAQDTHYVHVRFRPTDSIQYESYDTVGSTAGTIWIQLLGRGIFSKISLPSPIDFDSVRVGQVECLFVRIKDIGNAVVHIELQSIDSSEFLLNPQPLTIAPGNTDSVNLCFRPNAPGSVTSKYRISWYSGSDSGTTIVIVNGVGYIPQPVIKLPASILFGSTRLGLCGDPNLGPTIEDTIRFNNIGDTILRVNSVVSQDPSFIIDNFSKTVAPFGVGMIAMHFCPAQTQPYNSIVKVISNDPKHSSTSFSVSGVGVTYIPRIGSVWRDGVSDSLNRDNVVTDSDFKQLAGASDVLRCAIVGGDSTIISTIDSTKLMFYTNDSIPSFNGPLFTDPRWLPFPILKGASVFDTTLELNSDNTAIIFDSLALLGSGMRNIAGKEIYFDSVLWYRRASDSTSSGRITPFYTRISNISYSSHLGMIFVDAIIEYEVGVLGLNQYRPLISYHFK